MKIVFLVSSLNSGGAERVATTLCNAWAARGDRVTLIPTYSGGGVPFYELDSAVELIYLADEVGQKRKTLLGYLQRLITLRRLIKSRQPDVIVSFLPNVNVAAIVASAFLGIPLVVCERTDPSSYPCDKSWEFAAKAMYRYADMLTVQTDAVAVKAAQMYSVRRIRSIENPLPDEIIKIEKSYLPRKRKTLLSLGRLSSEKQVDKIIYAFASVAGRFNDWDLHIYGDGPLREMLARQIQEQKLAGRVFLMGKTNDPWHVMADADAFVMTSKCEGFPNALLEAMGVGLPCIAFDCPSGPREITDNGNLALLVKLNDLQGLIRALEQIMRQEDFRVELGKRARAAVLERYNLSKVLEKWDQLFLEVGARR